MQHDPHSFHMVSVNLGKCHAALLSLLSTSSADCLLIQEPPWTISTPLHSDSDPTGTPRYQALHHPGWSFLAPPPPYVALNHGPHVMIYWCRSLPFSFTLAPTIQTYFLMGVDIMAPGFSLRLFNFYHHVPRQGHNLRQLLDLDVPSSSPCLVAGNFNSHSHVWSLPHSPASPWAQELESWFLEQDLMIINPPLSPTWHNANETHFSVIDLMVVNSAELAHWPIQSSCDVSFPDASDSDHAALSLCLPLLSTPPPLPIPPVSGWHVNPLFRDRWVELFREFSFPSHCDSWECLLDLWSTVRSAIKQVCDSLFATRGSHS